MMENETTNSTEIINDEFVEIGKIFYASLSLVGLLLSLIFLSIHLVKFLRSNGAQSIITKNVTSYCFCLFMIYLFNLTSSVGGIYHEIYIVVDTILKFAASFLLFVMSLDVCLCFKKTSRILRKITASDKTFAYYTVIGWVIPGILALLAYTLLDAKLFHKVSTFIIMSVRLLCLIPFFVSLWFLNSAKFDKKTVKKRFILHIRLMVMAGALSVVLNTFLGIELLSETSERSIWSYIPRVLFLYEGFIVTLCFTFHKYTFKSNTITDESDTQAPETCNSGSVQIECEKI